MLTVCNDEEIYLTVSFTSCFQLFPAFEKFQIALLIPRQSVQWVDVLKVFIKYADYLVYLNQFLF